MVSEVVPSLVEATELTTFTLDMGAKGRVPVEAPVLPAKGTRLSSTGCPKMRLCG